MNTCRALRDKTRYSRRIKESGSSKKGIGVREFGRKDMPGEGQRRVEGMERERSERQ